MTEHGGNVLPDASPLARRRRTLLRTAVLAVSLSVAGLVLSTQIRSPAQVAADTEPPGRTLLTAPVERRVLNETVVLRATIAQTRTVNASPTAAHGADRAIVTGVRVKVGALVKQGQVIAEVSGRPVIVLAGEVPAYRDIRPRAHGRDVSQLQAALRRMGYRIADRGTFGASSKRALTKLYDAIGYPVPDTGPADNEAVDQAKARVREAKQVLARTRADTPAASPDVTVAKAALAQAERDLASLVARTGPMLPRDEVVFVPGFPARVVKLNAVVGQDVQAPLATIATGDVVAMGTLSGAASQGIAVGQPAEILMSATGRTFPGKVIAAGADLPTGPAEPVAGDRDKDSASPAQQPRFGVIVAGDATLNPQLVGQDVRLTVVVRRSRQPVLVVPVAAVFSAADSSVSVTVAGPSGKRTVAVTLGESGDGYVQVTPLQGATLDAGDQVVVGAR